MKKNFHHKLLVLLLLVYGIMIQFVQAQEATEVSPTILGLRYFLPQTKVPYILVTTKKKVGRKFEPVSNVTVQVYVNETTESNLLGTVTTAGNGEGKIAFPASFKNIWDAQDELKFVAASVPAKGEESLSADLTIKKAILVIDTLNNGETRSVTAQLQEKSGDVWVPVKEIEMKLGVKRMLQNLSVGDEATYTSDSAGTASAVFMRDSIPGDKKGTIILVAQVEDNDVYGNLTAEKAVTWGKPVVVTNQFWHRSLWSTGDRAPYWLLFLALSIVAGVWGTFIYLILQLLKIRKLGKDYERTVHT